MAKTIEILDTTLRDGVQGEGIAYSVQDKIHIAQALDDLGIKYIEAGNPSSNPKDIEFFEKAKNLSLKNSRIVAFGSTRRKGCSCAEDENLQALLRAETPTVTVFGKAWDFQATEILQVSLEENLDMISETVAYLVKQGREVIFDAEHFFTGVQQNKEYAFRALNAAVKGGAHNITLCETKGGCMPLELQSISKEVFKLYGKACTIGIHTHNDSGLAVANTLLAVESGISHVQGVLLGFGERTGNANLSTIIPDLQLKMDCKCIDSDKLSLLTPVCKRVAEITNINLDSNLPYVGHNAFAHKAGMHIDAQLKNSSAYEHVSPESVGNERVLLMSEVAGRSMIVEKMKKFLPDISKNDSLVKEVVNELKKKEQEGYQFEGADGSFELLIRKAIGAYTPFFHHHYYKLSEEIPLVEKGLYAFAQVKLSVDNRIEIAAGEGNGPVHALDCALRAALKPFYPVVENITLIDYKVRVLDGHDATASRVRVLIESSDGKDSWTTVGVSSDVVEASWKALVDSFEFKLIKDKEENL